MRSTLKALFYAALLAACYWCGYSAYRDYALLMMEDGGELARRERARPAKGTNAPPLTAEATDAATEADARPAKQNPAVAPPPAAIEAGDDNHTVLSSHRVGRNYLRLLGYTLGFAGALTVLGFVAAQDFGHLLRFRTGKPVSYVSASSERKGQYERAEYLILKGDHHEAIRQLQALLVKQPGNVHAALRVAEIYDKELQDFPSAALQYEHVLQLPVPPEQWGWIAIRLANIYSGKLNRAQAALELVRRLAAEHPETQAGGKALKRLARIASAGIDVETQGDV